MIALLGKRDIPADGVKDYCALLGQALARCGVKLKLVQVDWTQKGWARALQQLWGESDNWRGKWVLLQYTALGWSRRGFPFGALAALAILRRHGTRCAVVFHEPYGLGGRRSIDRIRGACQQWVVQTLYRRASRGIFTIPLDTINWLPKGERKAAFIPIGANIPECLADRETAGDRDGAGRTVAVFGLSDPPNLWRELSDISHAMRSAARNVAKLRLVFLGRGTAEAKEGIDRAFEGSLVEVWNLGVRPAEEVSRALAESDAMLCVRGELTPRRGSAIAGIACGLPILGYGDAENIFPIGEAGVQLVPLGNSEALASALARVLNDRELRTQLSARSREAQKKYFSWEVIARRMIQTLEESQPRDESSAVYEIFS